MKQVVIQLLMCFVFFSCTNINRDKIVDKSELLGDDYRLFQNTPAWGLAKAIEDKDETKINEILSKDKKLIDYQEPKYGNTLLILTIMNQQMKPFKILLEHKADISIHNTFDGTSALIEACSFEQYDIKFVKLLLQNGANVNDVQTDTVEPDKVKTALMKASETGKLDLVDLLIKNGTDINYKNEFGQSALSQCILVDKYNIALCLLKSGADFKSPIFYRPDYSVPSELRDPNDKGSPMYLVDALREACFDFNTEEYKYKMQIVDFLKTKGIDYRSTPIPEYIKKEAKENYPKNWQEYLEKY